MIAMTNKRYSLQEMKLLRCFLGCRDSSHDMIGQMDTVSPHVITKMQDYIELFGSGMNFYGGLDEAAHKTFVKPAGQKTQHLVGDFAK
jgi:hypothetical protein